MAICASALADDAPMVLLSGDTTAKSVGNAATKTTLTISAGTLGQPVTFDVAVRTAAAAGAPTGTVAIIDHGKVIQTLTLSPTNSTDSRYAYSDASYTLIPQPGSNSYFFGRHPVSAMFIPEGNFLKSSAGKVFVVSTPAYTNLSDGVKFATIVEGSGTGIQSGQTASMLYTGYLARNGKIFDDSSLHGGTPFTFMVGVGQVIPGFDMGTIGMKVGETRIIFIPPAEGYGKKPNGSIPGNSTLIFVITLESFS